MGRITDRSCVETLNVVAGNIRRLRGLKNMDQDLLAKAAEVSRATISAAETGSPVNLQSLIKIAHALGVGPADLFLTDEDRAEVTYKLKLLTDRLKI